MFCLIVYVFSRSKLDKPYYCGDAVEIRSAVKQQPASHREAAEINPRDIFILIS